MRGPAVDTLRAQAEARLLRLTSLILFGLVVALLGLITSGALVWSKILFHDGDVLSAVVDVSVGETVFRQLTGRYALSVRHFDDVWSGEKQCSGSGRNSDVCAAIRIKQANDKEIIVTLAFVIALTLWPLYYFSWLCHKMRRRTLESSPDPVIRVNKCGCRLSEDGLTWSLREWTRDPCTAIVMVVLALLIGVVFGMAGWPAGVELFRNKLVKDLGATNLDITNPLTSDHAMSEGYDMFSSALALLLLCALVGTFVRTTFRTL